MLWSDIEESNVQEYSKYEDYSVYNFELKKDEFLRKFPDINYDLLERQKSHGEVYKLDDKYYEYTRIYGYYGWKECKKTSLGYFI
jgi:hypothetical protein